MQLATNLDSVDVGSLLDAAVREVFNTMLGLESALSWSSPEESVNGANPFAGGHHESSLGDSSVVVGTVGFIGEINGLIYLYCDLQFANDITHRLLQIDLSDLGDEAEGAVNDAVGEITNMVVGGFKNKLCDRGFPCRLTIPSILRGSHLSIEPVGFAHRRIYKFSIGGHLLTTDVVLKIGD